MLSQNKQRAPVMKKTNLSWSNLQAMRKEKAQKLSLRLLFSLLGGRASVWLMRKVFHAHKVSRLREPVLPVRFNETMNVRISRLSIMCSM